MTEAEVEAGWHQARIQECLALMARNHISLEELAQTRYIAGMANIAVTLNNPAPAVTGNTVAGQ